MPVDKLNTARAAEGKQMIEIKCNPVLFEEWKDLARRVDSLKSVVQNDMEIEESEFDHWQRMVQGMQDRLTELMLSTTAYVKYGLPPKVS